MDDRTGDETAGPEQEVATTKLGALVHAHGIRTTKVAQALGTQSALQRALRKRSVRDAAPTPRSLSELATRTQLTTTATTATARTSAETLNRLKEALLDLEKKSVSPPPAPPPTTKRAVPIGVSHRNEKVAATPTSTATYEAAYVPRYAHVRDPEVGRALIFDAYRNYARQALYAGLAATVAVYLWPAAQTAVLGAYAACKVGSATIKYYSGVDVCSEATLRAFFNALKKSPRLAALLAREPISRAWQARLARYRVPAYVYGATMETVLRSGIREAVGFAGSGGLAGYVWSKAYSTGVSIGFSAGHRAVAWSAESLRTLTTVDKDARRFVREQFAHPETVVAERKNRAPPAPLATARPKDVRKEATAFLQQTDAALALAARAASAPRSHPPSASPAEPRTTVGGPRVTPTVTASRATSSVTGNSSVRSVVPVAPTAAPRSAETAREQKTETKRQERAERHVAAAVEVVGVEPKEADPVLQREVAQSASLLQSGALEKIAATSALLAGCMTLVALGQSHNVAEQLRQLADIEAARSLLTAFVLDYLPIERLAESQRSVFADLVRKLNLERDPAHQSRLRKTLLDLLVGVTYSADELKTVDQADLARIVHNEYRHHGHRLDELKRTSKSELVSLLLRSQQQRMDQLLENLMVSASAAVLRTNVALAGARAVEMAYEAHRLALLELANTDLVRETGTLSAEETEALNVMSRQPAFVEACMGPPTQLVSGALAAFDAVQQQLGQAAGRVMEDAIAAAAKMQKLFDLATAAQPATVEFVLPDAVRPLTSKESRQAFRDAVRHAKAASATKSETKLAKRAEAVQRAAERNAKKAEALGRTLPALFTDASSVFVTGTVVPPTRETDTAERAARKMAHLAARFAERTALPSVLATATVTATTTATSTSTRTATATGWPEVKTAAAASPTLRKLIPDEFAETLKKTSFEFTPLAQTALYAGMVAAGSWVPGAGQVQLAQSGVWVANKALAAKDLGAQVAQLASTYYSLTGDVENAKFAAETAQTLGRNSGLRVPDVLGLIAERLVPTERVGAYEVFREALIDGAIAHHTRDEFIRNVISKITFGTHAEYTDVTAIVAGLGIEI